MPQSIEQFGKSLVGSGLMSPDDLKAYWNALPADGRPKDGEAFARLLVERGKLTDFQAKQLSAGQGKSLVLGDYVILQEIGAGGMGQVYKARHRRMDRIVALKVMSDAAMKDAAAVKRFQREVRAAARLEHPNIVTAYDSGESGNVKYLVMQFVDGGDLTALVRSKGPLSIDAAVDFVVQTARGLAFAHAEGVIHRDIKPANLLLDKKGVVKILDMGLARFEDGGDGLTATEQVMGTVDYMSPEQAANTKGADGRSDIYSLGCTLWFLLTGKKTYDGDTLIARLMAHRDAPLPSLVKARDDAPWALERVLHKMLAKRPEDRYQTMDEVIAAFEAFSGSSLSALTGSPGIGTPGGGSSGTQNAELASFMQAMATGAKTQTAQPGTAATPTATPAAKTDPQVDATQAFQLPEVDTDPKSELLPKAPLATSLATRSPRRASQATPPTKRPPVKLIAAGIGGLALLVLLGIWVIVRDKDGNEVARVQVPEGGSVTVQPAAATGANPVATPSSTPSFFTPGATPAAAPMFLAPPTSPGVRNLPAGKWGLKFEPGQYVETVPVPFRLTTVVTIEAWLTDELVNVSTTSGIGLVEELNGRIIRLQDQLRFYTHHGNPPDVPAVTNRRYHLAGVNDGKQRRLYIDGKLVSQIDDPGSVPQNRKGELRPLLLGDKKYFAGVLDAVRFSSTARYDKDFTPPTTFTPDKETVALYLFDEGQGDTLKDSSGNGYHGKISGATWVRGGATSTPGSPPPGDYVLELAGFANRPEGAAWVDVPSLLLSEIGPLTLEARVRAIGHNEAWVLGTDDCRLRISGGSWTTKTPNLLTQKYPIEFHRWYHVATVRTDREVRMYVDGKRFDTLSLPSRTDPQPPPKSSPLKIGGNNAEIRLDEVRISKTARYDKDFTPPLKHVPDADTLALYHCDEGIGDVLRDASSNKHDGKITKPAWVRADGSPVNTAGSLNATSMPAVQPSASATLTTARWPYDPPDGREYVWSEPENLGPKVNTAGTDAVAGISDDDLKLFYARDRKAYWSERKSPTESFGDAIFIKQFGVLNAYSYASNQLVAVIERKLPKTKPIIWLSSRKQANDALSDPIQLPEPVNADGGTGHPALSADGLTLLAGSTRTGGQSSDIWMFTRQAIDQPFTTAERLIEPVSTPDWDMAFHISNDRCFLIVAGQTGTEVEEEGNQARKNIRLVRYFTRSKPTDPFGPGLPLGIPLGAAENSDRNGGFRLSSDGRTIYFHTSELPGGVGNGDIWLSRRVAKPGTSSPASNTSVVRWPLAASKPEDIQRLLDFKAKVTVRTPSPSGSAPVDTTLNPGDALPAVPATIVGVIIHGDPVKADDALLGFLASLTDLEDLNFGGYSHSVTPGGVRKLVPLVRLRRLDVYGLKDQAAGASDLLKSLPELEYLHLPYGAPAPEWAAAAVGRPSITEINAFRAELDDAGLAVLEKMPQLRSLRLVDNPKLTQAAIERLAAAVPGCRISWGTSQDTKIIEPRRQAVLPAAAGAGVVYLDDLPETEFKNSRFPLGKHGMQEGKVTIDWHGKQPAHSLFMHPNPSTTASVAYALDGRYDSFAAIIGKSAKGDSPNPLTFRVLGDGRELWKSPPIQNPTDEAAISVSVAGVKELRLEVDCPGNGYNARAVWIDPRLTPAVQPQPPAVVYLDDLPEKSYVGLDGRLFKPGRNADDAAAFAKVFVAESPVHTLMMHPAGASPDQASRATYDLAAGYSRFRAQFRVRARARAAPIFAEVWGDGRRLWESGDLEPRKVAGATADVDVHGVRELTLVVRAETNAESAHTLLIEPRLTPAESAASAAAKTIPAEALAFSGHRYLLVADATGGFHSAEAEARKSGGHLAVIDSKSERDWVRDEVWLKRPNRNNSDRCLLGGEIAPDRKSGTWITGEPVDLTLWTGSRPGPDNTGNEPSYIHLTFNDGGWDDLPGDQRSGRTHYLVEWDTLGPAVSSDQRAGGVSLPMNGATNDPNHSSSSKNQGANSPRSLSNPLGVSDSLDRQVARRLLDLQFRITIKVGTRSLNLAPGTPLPTEPFVISGLQPSNTVAAPREELVKLLADFRRLTGITSTYMPKKDCDLWAETFAAMPQLQAVNAVNCDELSDVGAAHLVRIPKLEYLNLSSLNVTRVGLAAFEKCPTLTTIELHQAAFDAGKFTLADIQKLQNALPKTRVVFGGLKPIPGLKPAAQDAAAGVSSLDLLATFDPAKSFLAGGSAADWRRNGAELVFTGSGKPGLVKFPAALVDRNYRLELELTRHAGAGGLNIDLPLTSGQFTINIDEQGRTGLSKTDQSIRDFRLADDRRTRLVVTIDGQSGKDVISLHADDRLLLSWQGDRQAAVASAWRPGQPLDQRWPGLYLHSGDGRFTIHKLQVGTSSNTALPPTGPPPSPR